VSATNAARSPGSLAMITWTLALAVVACGIAAVTDLRSRTIPNWLTIPIMLSGLLLHAAREGLGGLLLACLGLLVCFCPLYLLYARGAVGGGDVKLLAGLGALLGARDGLELELTAFTLVAGYALFVCAWRGRVLALLRASARASLHVISPGRFAAPTRGEGMELPMGLSIFAAVIALAARSLL
jgi:prepilin peptidase CpaA